MNKTTQQWSKIINGVKYQQLRNNDFNYMKQMFQTYATMKLPQSGIVVNKRDCRSSMVDLYNKCFQLNEMGFLNYIETKLPKRDFVAVINQL